MTYILNIKYIMYQVSKMNKEKIIYSTSLFIFFIPLLFKSLDKRKEYANKGLLILISWSICYVFSFIISLFSPSFIIFISNIITYTYPLYLAIKGTYMIYKEKEWDVPFLKNIHIFTY
jgi:hypothetical protein